MNAHSLSPAEFLVSLYFAEVAAFSICILILGRSVGRRTVALWLVANAVSMLTIAVARPLGVAYTNDGQPFLMSFVILSASIRYLAILGNQGLRKRMRLPNGLALSANAMMVLCFLPAFHSYRLLIFSMSGMLMAMAACLAVFTNPQWRGLQGQKVLFFAFALGVPAFFWRMTHAYPFGETRLFIGETQQQILGFTVLIVISFFNQFGFIILLRDRAARLDRFDQRRLARAFANAKALHDHNDRMEKVAAERLSLLNILTHEVRQPLNNAQAALSNLHMELAQPTLRRRRVAETVTAAQAVVDDVTLALSNAIIGATVIERGSGVSMAPASAMEIAGLALTDCPEQARERILLHSASPSLFVELDPVIVRLSLRNLLDNALKYSPSGSPITFEVGEDEDRCGVTFRVTNQITDPGLLQGNIFARAERGKSAEVEGKGLGLFIVQQTARIHGGEARYWLEHDGRSTFELFLPA